MNIILLNNSNTSHVYENRGSTFIILFVSLSCLSLLYCLHSRIQTEGELYTYNKFFLEQRKHRKRAE